MAKADLIDAMGIPLAEHHRWLPPRVSLFPTPKKIVDKEAAIRWKEGQCSIHRISGWSCWWCAGKSNPVFPQGCEVHHICRHDAPWAFFLACSDCHRHQAHITARKNFYRVLVLKQKYDSQNTLWLPLAIGLNRFLPLEDS